jgi:hypothetical protein
MNDEGLADAAVANPFRLSRLHPGGRAALQDGKDVGPFGRGRLRSPSHVGGFTSDCRTRSSRRADHPVATSPGVGRSRP